MKTKIKGQALIILLMLAATLTTVVFSLSFKSNIETQLTKLEEENQKALAAAQAGIEQVLKQRSLVNIGADILVGSGITGQARIENLPTKTFTSPLLKKDEQYTFYLTPYNSQTKTFQGNSISQTINVCFGSASFNPAIEITLIKQNSIKKYAVNPSSGENIIQNGTNAEEATTSDCPSDNNFSSKYPILASDIESDSRLLIVRIISQNNNNNQTKIGIKATNSNLPFQGDNIISSVKTEAGVAKEIKLFQSYPQIPAEFFVTRF